MLQNSQTSISVHKLDLIPIARHDILSKFFFKFRQHPKNTVYLIPMIGTFRSLLVSAEQIRSGYIAEEHNFCSWT